MARYRIIVQDLQERRDDLVYETDDVTLYHSFNNEPIVEGQDVTGFRLMGDGVVVVGWSGRPPEEVALADATCSNLWAHGRKA